MLIAARWCEIGSPPRAELAVLGAVAAAFLVGGAPGEVTEEAGPAGGYAPEALHQEQRDLVISIKSQIPTRLGQRKREDAERF